MNLEDSMSPAELLESRLTSLALGELDAEQVAELRSRIAGDPGLAAEYARIEAALKVLRQPGAVAKETPEAPRFSEERRRVMLTLFRSGRKPEVVQPPRIVAGLAGRWRAVRTDLLKLAAMLASLMILGRLVLQRDPDSGRSAFPVAAAFVNQSGSEIMVSASSAVVAPEGPYNAPTPVPTYSLQVEPEALAKRERGVVSLYSMAEPAAKPEANFRDRAASASADPSGGAEIKVKKSSPEDSMARVAVQPVRKNLTDAAGQPSSPPVPSAPEAAAAYDKLAVAVAEVPATPAPKPTSAQVQTATPASGEEARSVLSPRLAARYGLQPLKREQESKRPAIAQAQEADAPGRRETSMARMELQQRQDRGAQVLGWNRQQDAESEQMTAASASGGLAGPAVSSDANALAQEAWLYKSGKQAGLTPTLGDTPEVGLEFRNSPVSDSPPPPAVTDVTRGVALTNSTLDFSLRGRIGDESRAKGRAEFWGGIGGGGAVQESLAGVAQVQNLQEGSERFLTRLSEAEEGALAQRGASGTEDVLQDLAKVQASDDFKDSNEVAQHEPAEGVVKEVASRSLDILPMLSAATDKDLAEQEKPGRPAVKVVNPLVPQPEVTTFENPFSTFSLNVSDVSFKTAEAALERGVMPDPGSIRSEEFFNAFDYRDPEPTAGAPLAFRWERSSYPFGHRRELLRFSVKTAAAGRQPGRPMNIVLLVDNSGSMERTDRVGILRECVRALGAQLRPEDVVSVVAFARTARLCLDGMGGANAGSLPEVLNTLQPQGGTNLEDALDLAYETALKHYRHGGMNRVVLLTDGAANLGDVDPASLKTRVETHRKKGVALDCFGIGWEGLNDDLLENLSRNGDGRYGFVNSPESAGAEFGSQLAGALNVAASDVKMQVEFNPKRTKVHRQMGYARHQLTQEQFRDNTVDAAEIAAAEAGNALYVVQVDPQGEGPIAVVRARFRIPGTSDYREHSWNVPWTGTAQPLEAAPVSLRLAAAAGGFAEWLSGNPHAAEISPNKLLKYLAGVSEQFEPDTRPRRLESMIRQAGVVSGIR